MVRFFQISDPLRYIGVVLVLLLAQLPMLWAEYPQTIPELSWTLVGERMGDGLSIYKDIADNTGFLSAQVYWVLDVLFDRSVFAYRFFAFLLLLIQGFTFNEILNRTNILGQKTVLPMLFYGLLSFLFFELRTLSPPLMANTFLLLALSSLLKRFKSGSSDHGVYVIGFYIGIAALFYAPSLVFLLLAFLSLLLYTNTNFRRYLLLFLGAIFPSLMVGMYFYWKGSFELFILDGWYYPLFSAGITLADVKGVSMVLFLPALLLLFAIIRVFGAGSYINYQVQCQGLMVMWLLFGTTTLFLAHEKAAFALYPIIPAVAFFLSFYLVVSKKAWVRESFFYLFLGTLFYFGYGRLTGASEFTGEDRLSVGQETVPSYGKVLVLGDDLAPYETNAVATRFLDWQLSKKYFLDLDSYYNVSQVYSNMMADLPDAIFDQEGVMDKLFVRIPDLKGLYRVSDSDPSMYLLIPKETAEE